MRLLQNVLAQATPGEYDYKAGEPPIITGISDLLKFGDRALFGTPEEKKEAKKTNTRIYKRASSDTS